MDAGIQPQLRADWANLHGMVRRCVRGRSMDDKFGYLGRQYRLKVVPHMQEGVKMIRGFIVVQIHRPTRPEVTREPVA